jgi:hypothetical protein
MKICNYNDYFNQSSLQPLCPEVFDCKLINQADQKIVTLASDYVIVPSRESLCQGSTVTVGDGRNQIKLLPVENLDFVLPTDPISLNLDTLGISQTLSINSGDFGIPGTLLSGESITWNYDSRPV